MSRIEELDIMRGFLLAHMMLNHMPGPHNDYTNQFFGFVSSAEGFFLFRAIC